MRKPLERYFRGDMPVSFMGIFDRSGQQRDLKSGTWAYTRRCAHVVLGRFGVNLILPF
jgi:hypothetical protein